MSMEGRQRCDRNVPRCAPPPLQCSAWNTSFNSGDDGAFAVAGFDCATFQSPLELFLPLFGGFTLWCANNDKFLFGKVNPQDKRGRKRQVTTVSCLGLVLAWFRFRGGEFVPQGWFGFTGSQLNVWPWFGGRMLLKALRQVHDSLVKMSTDEKIELHKEAVSKRHDALEGFHCAADGLKTPFQSCQRLTEQSVCHNGWTHGHCITDLFAFAVEGRNINAVTNVPGSVHDSAVAIWGGAHEKLKRTHEQTGGVCVCLCCW